MNSPAENLVPISIQDWVASAASLYSEDEYIKNSARLAFLLTKQLRQMASLAMVDISPYNITILVLGVNLLSIKGCAISRTNDVPRSSSSRAVNEALGNLLLQIFTKGASAADSSRRGSAKDLLLDSGMPLSICRIVCNLLSGQAIAPERPCHDPFISSLQVEVSKFMNKDADAAGG